MPTCCSCQIDGYREKFPPVADQDQELYSDARFSASDALYSLTQNDYNDDDSSSASFTPIVSTGKKQRLDKRKKLKRPASNLDTYLTPPANEYITTDSFKRKQSSVISVNREPTLIGGDDVPEGVSSPPHHSNDRPVKNRPIIYTTNKNGPRLATSKVLIKRVNYNYHPIIDFFFRDRSIKTGKAKEHKSGHSVVS